VSFDVRFALLEPIDDGPSHITEAVTSNEPARPGWRLGAADLALEAG
jgi:hypothetical protein